MPEPRIALAVGIDNYPDMPLSGCADDAKVFSKLMSFHENEERNFFVNVQLNVPSKASLKTLIAELFEKDVETAIFYFSGHGIFTKTGGYIVTPDGIKNDEGVSMDEVLAMANTSPAKDRIILLDCCNSGYFGASRHKDSTIAEIERGVTILTASNEREEAFQVNGRGVFTNLLLDALKGSAADLMGNITPGSIYTYIDQALGVYNKQRPIFKTNVSRFIVLRKVIPRIEESMLRKNLPLFPTEDAIFPLDSSFEFTNVESNPEAKKPFANQENVAIFKTLQKFTSEALVTPVGEKHMYFAAINSTGCKLTTLGQHYWRLVNNGKL